MRALKTHRVPKLTHIVWRDASYGTGGESDIDKIKLSELDAVGFILREDEESVLVSLEWFPGAETTRNWLLIPKTGIISRRDFSLPAPKI